MIKIQHLKKHYRENSGIFKKNSKTVLEDVTFTLHDGECLGIIGESGSGKSTLSRILLGLEKATAGTIEIDGCAQESWLSANRGQLSVVFQDYRTSVNPDWKIEKIIQEPLNLNKKSAEESSGAIVEMLEKVQLSPALLGKYPHELSGGQLQRVCIARALITHPKYLILDEAISSLDVSVQAQILTLLVDLQQEFQLTYLFIAHDLMAVSRICQRIAFLRDGVIIEEMSCSHLNCVESAYGKALFGSVLDFHSSYEKEVIQSEQKQATLSPLI